MGQKRQKSTQQESCITAASSLLHSCITTRLIFAEATLEMFHHLHGTSSSSQPQRASLSLSHLLLLRKKTTWASKRLKEAEPPVLRGIIKHFIPIISEDMSSEPNNRDAFLNKAYSKTRELQRLNGRLVAALLTGVKVFSLQKTFLRATGCKPCTTQNALEVII